MSFYECVKAYPEGSSSLSRMALVARGLGYRGIIICNRDPSKIFMTRAAEEITGIEVVIGAEAGASNARSLKSRIALLRPKHPFLAVQGASEEAVQASCEDANLDMLIVPCEPRRTLSIAAARSARQNQVSIGIDISPMIHLRGSMRARWIEALSRNLQIIRKFELTAIITAGARSHLDLRTPRDLMALAEVAGFEPDEAKEALQLPGKLLALNRRRWVGPGVELLSEMKEDEILPGERECAWVSASER